MVVPSPGLSCFRREDNFCEGDFSFESVVPLFRTSDSNQYSVSRKVFDSMFDQMCKRRYL